MHPKLDALIRPFLFVLAAPLLAQTPAPTPKPALPPAPAHAPAAAPAAAPHSTVPLAPGLSFADPMTLAAPHDFLRAFPARTGANTVNAVVEIPTGACEKWEVKLDGTMRWDIKNGAPRVVDYLGYPANYGIVPRAILGRDQGGDGDPLDVVVLGPSLPRGTVLQVKVVGVIRLVDAGEKDDKIMTVRTEGPLSDVDDLDQLDAKYPGVTAILKTWFENYKGPGRLTCHGFGPRSEAQALITASEKSFAAVEANRPATAPK